VIPAFTLTLSNINSIYVKVTALLLAINTM